MIDELLKNAYEYLASRFKASVDISSIDLIDSLKSAIINNNSTALDDIIAKLQLEGNKIVLKKNSKKFLSMCYFNSNFNFAEKLIKAGAEFKSKNVVYTIRKHNDESIKHHMKVIKPYITNEEFLNANKIINAMNSPLQIFSDKESTEFKTWHKITHTDDKRYLGHFNELYKSFINDTNPIIPCMFYFVNHANSFKTNVKIIAPVIDEEPFSAFHNFKLGLVYTPFKNFSYLDRSIFLHEIGHYIVYKQFNNLGMPFKKDDYTQEKEYDLAATEVLCKIGELVRFKCDREITERFTSVKIANDLFQNSPIPLFNYNAMFKKGVFSDQITDKFLNHIIQKFNISPSLVKEFGSKRAISITIDKIIQDLQLNSDSLLILERIGDYISRGNEEEYLSELLPRILEFIGSGIKTEALSLFQPLSYYLGKNICTPDNGVLNVICKEFIGESLSNGEEL